MTLHSLQRYLGGIEAKYVLLYMTAAEHAHKTTSGSNVQLY